MLIPAVLLLLQIAPSASPCTQLRTTSAAASPLCQGTQAARSRRWQEAAQHYRRAVDLVSDADGKQRALDALADVYEPARLNRPDLLEGVLREAIALTPQ